VILRLLKRFINLTNNPIMFKLRAICLAAFCAASLSLKAQTAQQPVKPLAQLQQEFVDLRFGMFIHFNIPTYMDQDWADPEALPTIFNPKKTQLRSMGKGGKIGQHDLRLYHYQTSQRFLYLGYQNNRL